MNYALLVSKKDIDSAASYRLFRIHCLNRNDALLLSMSVNSGHCCCNRNAEGRCSFWTSMSLVSVCLHEASIVHCCLVVESSYHKVFLLFSHLASQWRLFVILHFCLFLTVSFSLFTEFHIFGWLLVLEKWLWCQAAEPHWSALERIHYSLHLSKREKKEEGRERLPNGFTDMRRDGTLRTK